MVIIERNPLKGSGRAHREEKLREAYIPFPQLSHATQEVREWHVHAIMCSMYMVHLYAGTRRTKLFPFFFLKEQSERHNGKTKTKTEIAAPTYCVHCTYTHLGVHTHTHTNTHMQQNPIAGGVRGRNHGFWCRCF